MDHEREVSYGVTQHAAAEALRVLPYQIARQETAVRAANHCHTVFINKPCIRAHFALSRFLSDQLNRNVARQAWLARA
jgi:hypothetical protein